MATKKENERLAVVETEMKQLKNDVHEVRTDLKVVKDTLNALPDELIRRMDERYVLKTDLIEMKETIEPLTKLRKRIWGFMVAIMVAEAFAVYVLASDLKNLLK